MFELRKLYKVIVVIKFHKNEKMNMNGLKGRCDDGGIWCGRGKSGFRISHYGGMFFNKEIGG